MKLAIRAIGIAALGILGGCASAPNVVSEPSAQGIGELYEGQPETVFATELPVESADDARSRAVRALGEQNLDLALYMYVEAAKLDPADDESMYRIGAIHERRGNVELASRAYARAVEIGPAHALALQGLGRRSFDARDMDSAAPLLERAVAADPGLWRAHNMLGVIADMRNDYAAAVEHYSTALALQPQSPAIFNNRGYSKYLAGDLEGAEADFRAAVELDADYERAWQNLGLLYARERQYTMAIGTLSRTAERHVALNDVGYIAMLDGDYVAAERLFAEAVRISPRYYKTAVDNLAELRRRRSSTAAAAPAVPAASAALPQPTSADRSVGILLPREALARYAGTYKVPPGYNVTITLENDRLMWQAMGQTKTELHAGVDGRFFFADEDAEIAFVTEGGQVTALVVHQGLRSRRAPRQS